MGKVVLENEELRVRTVEEEDKYHLVKWLSTSEVLRYYEGRDNSFSVEKIEGKFLKDEEKTTRCMIEFGDVPIGYVQFYEVDEKDRRAYGYRDSMEVIYGMDQFIGESEYWSQGIGTKVVRSIVEHLIQEKGADRIVMDPQSWNERALRCYEKCGFKKVKLLPGNEWHEGEYRDSWLMEFNFIQPKSPTFISSGINTN